MNDIYNPPVVAQSIMDGLVVRRRYLRTNKPQCPVCEEWHQIQLTAWDAAPAGWRCRTCGHSFLYEPEPATTSTPKDKLPPDPDGGNDARAAAAEEALITFMELSGSDPEDAIGDLVADLGHLCDRQLEKYGELEDGIRRGQTYYDDETSPDPT